MMYELGRGILPHSVCVPLTATAHAQEFYFYPVLCGHYFCDAQYEVQRERYENPLLLFIRSGALRIQYHEQTYLAVKGEVVLLDCDCPHYYGADGNVEFLYLHFDGCHAHDLVRDIISHTPVIRKEQNISVGEQLYTFIQSFRRYGIQNEVDCSMRIYQLLMQLAMPPERVNRQDNPINQSITYIRKNVGKAITLQELSNIAHLSASQFSHAFKRQTGFSPMEYVINTRLEKAKMLLLQTTMTVSDIAYEVGYQSSFSLSNLFIQKVGCSPREYRRTNGIDIRQSPE